MDLALVGTYTFTLADGRTVPCRPVLALLQELAAEYAPERSEAIDLGASSRRAPGRPPVRHRAALVLRTWVGLEEHANATQTSRAVALFYALTGQFDQRGSNVLFASTATNSLAGRDLLPKEQASRTLGAAERPLGPPRTAGQVTAYDMYRAILTAQPYPVKGLITFGTDVLMGNGDPLRGKAALEALDFYVHVDLFANPSASLADLLLPAASCWERASLRPSLGTGAETATWAQFREPVVQPLHESRSEVAIIFDLATRLGLGQHFFDGDIEAAYSYELAPSGLTVQQLRQHPMGMWARGETRFQKYAEIDAATGQPRGFPTPTRKVEIYSTHFARAGYAPLPVYQEPGGSPLALTWPRSIRWCSPSSGWCNTATCNTATSRVCVVRSQSHSWRSTRPRLRRCAFRTGNGSSWRPPWGGSGSRRNTKTPCILESSLPRTAGGRAVGNWGYQATTPLGRRGQTPTFSSPTMSLTPSAVPSRIAPRGVASGRRASQPRQRRKVSCQSSSHHCPVTLDENRYGLQKPQRVGKSACRGRASAG